MPASPDALLTRALHAAVGDTSESIDDLFCEDVVVWSPNMFVTSRSELANEWGDRDDAITSPEITISAVDVVGPKAIVEWRIDAVHSGPFHLEGDVVLEGTGRQVVLAGVSIAETRDGKIAALRSYFDDAALLEQMLATD